MTEIPEVYHIVDGIYVGGARANLHAEALQEAGITHILKLYLHDVSRWPEGFVVHSLLFPMTQPIPEGKMLEGIKFIQEQVEAGNKVMVACSHGIKCAPVFVVGYLLEKNHELREAWQLIKKQNPNTACDCTLCDTLLAHYKLPYTADDIEKWLAEA